MCNEIEADIEPEWIWGDNAETTVYAQAYGSGFTIIFSFGPNYVVLGRSRSSSLAHRISAYYHDPSSAGKDVGFVDRTAMREELWRAVRKVWPKCIDHPLARRLDSIVRVDTGEAGEICWNIYCHPLFPRFIKYLGELAGERRLPAEDFTITNQLVKDGKPELRADADIVDFATLTRFEQLGGKGCATKVRVGADGEAFSVFKGIDFRTFLTYCGSDEDGSDDNAVKLLIENWYHSIGILCDMPPHPNIISSSTIFVVIKDPNISDCDTPVVCGCLYPFLSKGDVGARIEASNKGCERIPLRLKARWCAQMTSAVKHASRRAHLPHGYQAGELPNR